MAEQLKRLTTRLMASPRRIEVMTQMLRPRMVAQRAITTLTQTAIVSQMVMVVQNLYQKMMAEGTPKAKTGRPEMLIWIVRE